MKTNKIFIPFFCLAYISFTSFNNLSAQVENKSYGINNIFDATLEKYKDIDEGWEEYGSSIEQYIRIYNQSQERYNQLLKIKQELDELRKLIADAKNNQS